MLSNVFSGKVTIVLLNYNGANDTIDCLQSLLSISYHNYNIIIVDNDSSDKSIEEIKIYMQNHNIEHIIFPSIVSALEDENQNTFISIIQSEHNGGYGYGNNIGIKYALKNNADYVLILNNDTVVDPCFLEPIVQMCEKDKSIGIATGKIYFYDKPDTIWSNGGKFNHCIAKVEHMNFNEKDIGQKPPKENTFISGCMWLIPKQVFERVGLINEEYFMYVEDLEFCQRVLNVGYKLNVCTQSKIWHKVGSTTGGAFSNFSVAWRSKNMNKFIRVHIKNFGCRVSASLYYNIFSIFKLLKHWRIDLIITHVKGIR